VRIFCKSLQACIIVRLMLLFSHERRILSSVDLGPTYYIIISETVMISSGEAAPVMPSFLIVTAAAR
jgi:hypothetical protein